MSLKSSLLALSENIGMCQENARSIKQALTVGLAGVATNASGIDGVSSIKKLWKNEHPGDAFAGGTVTVDNSDDFDAFIIFTMDLSGECYLPYMADKSFINTNVSHSLLINHMNGSAGKIIKIYRGVKLDQAEGSDNVVLTFTNATTSTINTYGEAASDSTTNNVMVPQFILGVKF